MSNRYGHARRWADPTTLDVRPECGVCLDFGHLEHLGPCPWCEPDAENEHYLQLAADIAALDLREAA